MAQQQHLQVISDAEEIELQAYKSDGKFLLRLSSRNLSMVCCRTAESNDLIIREVMTGSALFIIGGAEILQQAISVYFSPGNTIGTIDNGVVRYTNGNTIQIQICNEGFKIRNNVIATNEQYFLISFSFDSSIEEKILTTAFAVHLALGPKKAELKKTLRKASFNFVEGGSNNTADQRQAINSSLTAPKSFQNLQPSQTYHLMRMARPSQGERIFVVLDDTQRHNIILFLLYNSIDGFLNAVNTNGKSEFVVNRTPYPGEEFTVMRGQKLIGKASNFKKDADAKLTIYEQSTETHYTVKQSRKRLLDGQLVNSQNQPLIHYTTYYFVDAQFKTYFPLENSLNSVFLAFFSFLYVLKCKAHTMTPVSKMSILDSTSTSPLSQSFQPTNFENDLLEEVNKEPFHQLFAVGHNSSLNIVYVDCLKRYSVAHLTLECTPVDKFQGMAKLVAKDPVGRTIFSAVSFPPNGQLGIYGRDERLIAYEKNEEMLDANDQIIFTHYEFAPNIQKPFNAETGSGRNAGYKVFHKCSNIQVMEIFPKYNFVKIKRYDGLQEEGNRPLQAAVSLALAAKLFWGMYKRAPRVTPEISFRYRGSTEGAQFLSACAHPDTEN